jgi:DNA-binding NarL/FixJ family response regulator
MKILIADDHSAIRIGLKHILKHEFENSEFAEAANSAEVLQLATSKPWDVIILDINMPGRNGLEVLRQLNDIGLKIPVLVFSFHQEYQVAIRALRSGAAGFLSKDASDEEIVKAIRQITQGRKYITMAVAEMIASQLESPEDRMPHELLSEREFQTLLLIASGKTVSQVAEELSLSVPTISTYRSRIMEKMNMRTNADLTRYVLENRLI